MKKNIRFFRNRLGRKVPEKANLFGEIEPYAKADKRHIKYITEEQEAPGKVVASIREVLEKADIKDGMTISFHHHLRAGDYVLEMVMKEIAEMGIKDLTLCVSSLTSAHECLIDHIKNGVVTGIETSGIRGKLAEAISRDCILENAVIFRTHGGRARAIEQGDVIIDIAFVAASCCDNMGNMNGQAGKSAFGSMGYPMVDARYAKKTVVITDNLAPYPVYPISIPQTLVDYVVVVDQIGDPEKIGTGATRKSKDPVELAIAKYASQVIFASGLVKDGFSYQAGSGGISLSVAGYLADYMKEHNIVGGFASGGVTSAMTEMLEKGYFRTLLDVQTFDSGAISSLRNNPNHIEMDASMYADPLTKNCVTNNLDIMILSATEIDVNFNINVLTASNGVIMGALGGHPDTAAGAKLAIAVVPLVRKRIPIVVDEVMNISTPGDSVDVVVTEYGIAVNPKNPVLKEKLIEMGLPVFEISELRDKAYRLTGVPKRPEFGDTIVGIVEYRDGTVIDTIMNVL
ncbi:MAG: citrate lyase subunit alpha [Bacillota bacterium]|nr:citrate lyase subunit alpha [Bacillota bacterium]